MKTIKIPEDVHKELTKIKANHQIKTIGETIKWLIIDFEAPIKPIKIQRKRFKQKFTIKEIRDIYKNEK